MDFNRYKVITIYKPPQSKFKFFVGLASGRPSDQLAILAWRVLTLCNSILISGIYNVVTVGYNFVDSNYFTGHTGHLRIREVSLQPL